MAFSNNLLLISLLFAVLLISSEVVSAHRELAEATQTAGFHGNDHGHGGHGGHGGRGGRGGHGGAAQDAAGFYGNDHGHGGHGGHGGRGGHGAAADETETGN
ncbi:glycine-rich cell wall structural protein-like [Argentina anserina]|uniref:glycine-rich cell wall structural protein-like n=1 Tax=Argentina anserina TaxID=57926 RepID=UPI002176957A|nr:glycine-rich cell wall structural protein-like [Potentilla anserina]